MREPRAPRCQGAKAGRPVADSIAGPFRSCARPRSWRRRAAEFRRECFDFGLAHLCDGAFVDEVLLLSNDSIIAVGAAVPGDVAAVDGVVFELSGEVGSGINAGLWRGRGILVPGEFEDLPLKDVAGFGILRLGV